MKNPIKAALAAGQTALGYLVMIPSVGVVQALAAGGADFLLIDMEHSPTTIEAAAAMITATTGTATAPIIRVPGPESDLVKPVLDSGAFGIAFPQIATVEQARTTVEVTRYKPAGARGFGPAHAALRWGMPALDYVRIANDEVLNIVLIESVDGVAALDDILSIEGLDIVVTARGDLAENLGIPGQFDHPRLKQVLAEAERKILSHGAVLGGAAGSPEEARAMIETGYRFVVLSTDIALVQGTAASQIAKVRG